MVNTEHEMPGDKKLVGLMDPIRRGGGPKSRGVLILTKKRIRRIADPHVRAHKVKGRNYYYFCRGTDPEIYLGTAEAILLAVKPGQNSIR